MSLPPVAIYGMGRFGRALAGALRRAGPGPLRTGGRRQGPAALLRGLRPGTLVMLSVLDDAIPLVAAEFAALPQCRRHSFVHASGAHGPALLRPLSRAGASVGAFHILQTFPPLHGGRRVAGSWCAIAGPPPLLRRLRALARRLEMRPFVLADRQRPAYHAAAVLASNALVALLDAGRTLLQGRGIGKRAAVMLLPLVLGTLENVATLGAETALTGPVVRGDAGTLRAHAAVLPATLKPLYRELMTQTIALALRSGRITPAQARQLKQALPRA